jgi:hypothetical protein
MHLQDLFDPAQLVLHDGDPNLPGGFTESFASPKRCANRHENYPRGSGKTAQNEWFGPVVDEHAARGGRGDGEREPAAVRKSAADAGAEAIAGCCRRGAPE